MAFNDSGIGTYFPIPPQQFAQAQALVIAAQQAYATMVVDFEAESFAMGAANTPQAQTIALALQQVNYYGSTGALWLAYNELGNVVVTPAMAPFLTQDRIVWIKNRLITIISSLQATQG